MQDGRVYRRSIRAIPNAAHRMTLQQSEDVALGFMQASIIGVVVVGLITIATHSVDGFIVAVILVAAYTKSRYEKKTK